MQPPSVPRKLRGHHDRFVMAAQAAPLSRGLALGVTVFAYPENFVTKRKIQHAITMAKTRATTMLRRQHIPPNVRVNSGLWNNKGLSAQIKLNWGASSPSRFKHSRLRAVT